MKRSGVWFVVIALGVVAAAVAGWRLFGARHAERPSAVNAEPALPPAPAPDPADVRPALFAELQPIELENCQLKRFGESHDGGYLLCANLLRRVRAGYSYGISGYDGWGCGVSRTLRVPIHEYDCFDLHAPVCEGGKTTFHGECVAGKQSTDQNGRLFETPEHQFAKNGDAARRLVMKIDVEGAEWDTFVHTPDDVLDRIDQLAVEFHGVDRQRYVDVVKNLKRLFYIANLHFNNYSCKSGIPPFPAWAYEVLFVNKRLGVPDRSGKRLILHPAHAPNNPSLADCQGSDPSTGSSHGVGSGE